MESDVLGGIIEFADLFIPKCLPEIWISTHDVHFFDTTEKCKDMNVFV